MLHANDFNQEVFSKAQGKVGGYLEIIIEKDPRILIFVIPMVLKLCHALHDTIEFLIPHETDECSFGLARLTLGH